MCAHASGHARAYDDDHAVVEEQRARMDVRECVGTPAYTLAFCAGGAFAAAWLGFGDALYVHGAHDTEPAITSVYWMPGALAVVACVLFTSAPSAVRDGGGSGSGRACSFAAFTCFFIALIGAMFLADSMRASSGTTFSYISERLLADALRNATTTTTTTLPPMPTPTNDTAVGNASSPNVTTTTTTLAPTPRPTVDYSAIDAAGEWRHLSVGYAIIATTALVFTSALLCVFAQLHLLEHTDYLSDTSSL
jgi:hypothetical protein